MNTAIDTNILLDILQNDPQHQNTSTLLLQTQNNETELIISPLVYTELLVLFLKKHDSLIAQEKLHEFLKDLDICIIPLENIDYTLAAQIWTKHIQKTKTIFCPKCGKENLIKCQHCTQPLLWRNHILTDFLIGAHAQNHAQYFLTRDRGYYKNNFQIKILG